MSATQPASSRPELPPALKAALASADLTLVTADGQRYPVHGLLLSISSLVLADAVKLLGGGKELKVELRVWKCCVVVGCVGRIGRTGTRVLSVKLERQG